MHVSTINGNYYLILKSSNNLQTAFSSSAIEIILPA